MTSSPTPERSILTPFNLIAALILGVGAVLLFLRFTRGLAATTNLTNDNPWGLWIGFDVVSGVALAAGGFVISSTVYLFGMKEYKPIVRPALLTGFLGYTLVVVGLLVDLGRPWRLPFPFIVQAGPTSALFEVALCVALYLTVLFIESTPAAFEWLGMKRWRKLVSSMTIALTIFGLLLSTLHQSSLGALYTIMPTKLHPLWYSAHLPVHFFVSAVAAGISMVILESMISHRALGHLSDTPHAQIDKLTLGLAKAGAITLAVYFAVRVVGLMLDNHLQLLASGWGAWYLVEMVGFVLVPCVLYAVAYRESRVGLARFAAGATVIGIILNRFNISFIAFNWQLPAEARYAPSWMEIWVSVALVTFGVVTFKWIASRMPILYEHPEFKGTH
jgi:Ni/Fe-hydrogenase subunit HybB-like protein